MTARQQWSVVGAVIAIMAAGLAVASHYMKDELFPVTIGSTAPDFRAKVLGDNRYKTLADYKGQVVLLNVWEPGVRRVRRRCRASNGYTKRTATRGSSSWPSASTTM